MPCVEQDVRAIGFRRDLAIRKDLRRINPNSEVVTRLSKVETSIYTLYILTIFFSCLYATH